MHKCPYGGCTYATSNWDNLDAHMNANHRFMNESNINVVQRLPNSIEDVENPNRLKDSVFDARDPINIWAKKINEWATTKGWNQNEVPFPEFIALCHSELSEALEEHRNNHDPDEIYFKDGKPEGIPIELADLIIRVLHYTDEHGINIGKALEIKMEYNKTRPYRHGGKVV